MSTRAEGGEEGEIQKVQNSDGEISDEQSEQVDSSPEEIVSVTPIPMLWKWARENDIKKIARHVKKVWKNDGEGDEVEEDEEEEEEEEKNTEEDEDENEDEENKRDGEQQEGNVTHKEKITEKPPSLKQVLTSRDPEENYNLLTWAAVMGHHVLAHKLSTAGRKAFGFTEREGKETNCKERDVDEDQFFSHHVHMQIC